VKVERVEGAFVTTELVLEFVRLEVPEVSDAVRASTRNQLIVSAPSASQQILLEVVPGPFKYSEFSVLVLNEGPCVPSPQSLVQCV